MGVRVWGDQTGLWLPEELTPPPSVALGPGRVSAGYPVSLAWDR